MTNIKRTRSEVLEARRNAVVGCCRRFADMQSCDCLERALLDDPAPNAKALSKKKKKQRRPVKGFCGEPWSTDGRHIYDRDGIAFAEVYRGGEEFAYIIVMCVNLLTNLPVRSDDGPQTEFQKHAMAILRHEAKLKGDDPR